MNCCKPFIPVEKRKPQNLLSPIDGGRLGWGWTYELFSPPPSSPAWGEEIKEGYLLLFQRAKLISKFK
jgi:hypothetical protein